MGIIRNTQYTGRFLSPTVASPQGKFKNRTTETSLDGTYIDELWANDQDALIQSLLISNETVLNGNPDEGGNSQSYKALIEQAQGRASYFVESAGSAADAYVVEETPNNQPPVSLFDGMYIKGILGFDNTGASTINAFGFGIVAVRNFDDSLLSEGQIKSGELFEAVFFNSSFRIIDRNEFNNKFRGKLFNGLHENFHLAFPLPANADDVKYNSQFVYVQPIPGVTATSAGGILTTTMSDVDVRGKQEFEITDVNHAQFKEVHRRFIAINGTWLPWEKIAPNFSVFATNTDGSSLIGDSLTFNQEPGATEGFWHTIGRTGSGATIIFPALDLVPVDADWVEIKTYMFSSNAAAGTPGADFSGTISVRPLGSISTDAAKTVANYFRVVLDETGQGIGISPGVSKVKLINSQFETRWDSSMTNNTFEIMVVGYGYNR